jgi:hypothetical protein
VIEDINFDMNLRDNILIKRAYSSDNGIYIVTDRQVIYFEFNEDKDPTHFDISLGLFCRVSPHCVMMIDEVDWICRLYDEKENQEWGWLHVDAEIESFCGRFHPKFLRQVT